MKNYTFKDKRYFQNIDNEKKSYFLGLIVADGSINYKLNTLQLSLKEEDSYILEELIKEIYYDRNLRKIDIYNKRNINHSIQYQITITSKDFIEDLKSYGIIQNKSKKDFKFNFDKIPKKYIKDFIRGYFDGDGCFYFNKKTKNSHVTLTGQTTFIKDLIDIIKMEIKNLGKLPVYHRNKNIKYNCTMQMGGNIQVKIFCDYIYNKSSFYLKRKYNKYIVALCSNT